jgi:hypothetical protein
VCNVGPTASTKPIWFTQSASCCTNPECFLFHQPRVFLVPPTQSNPHSRQEIEGTHVLSLIKGAYCHPQRDLFRCNGRNLGLRPPRCFTRVGPFSPYSSLHCPHPVLTQYHHAITRTHLPTSASAPAPAYSITGQHPDPTEEQTRGGSKIVGDRFH